MNWYKKFRQHNRKSRASAKITDRFWAFKKGFYLETVKIFKITRNNFHEYLPDRLYYCELHPINKVYTKIIDNKLYLPFLLKDYKENVPEYYFLIDKGRLVNLDPFSIELTNNSVIDLVRNKKKLVFKHCFKSGGQGYNLLEWDGEKFFLNKSIIKYEEVNLFIKSLDNYIITEYINQHKYAREINPISSNTVRLFCIWDNEEHKFFIRTALHRFGMGRNLVDSLWSGGMGAFIDIATGKIKNIGLIKEKGKHVHFFNPIFHPDSKMPIANVQVPNWDKVTQQALNILNNLSFLKFLGIDLVITESGFKILEMNSLPTLTSMQVEEGLLKDKKAIRFFCEISKIN